MWQVVTVTRNFPSIDMSNTLLYNVKLRLLWPGALQWRIYYNCLWDQLSTTFSNAAEVA